MACNTCVGDSKVSMTIPGRFKIQQLTKQEKSSCNCNCNDYEDVDIYPTSVIQAIKDACTGERLEAILNRYNHIYVSFRGNMKSTVNSINNRQRRQGLFITFANELGEVKTYTYTHRSTKDSQWETLSNWREVFVRDTYRVPKNLRIDCDKLLLDVLDEEGQIVETLSTKLPIDGSAVLNTKVVKKLPFQGTSGIIYLVPSSTKGSYNKYIWVPELRKFELLGDTILGGGSCVVGGSGTDTFVENGEVVGNELRLIHNNGNIVTIAFPTGGINLTEILNRITELENKVDKDTIYDDSELRNKVETLEGKEDKDTIFDPKDLLAKIKELSDEIDELKKNTTPTVIPTAYNDTELRNAINQINKRLDNLVDNDTIYDDSAIRELIENLKRLIPTDTNKFAVRGEWIDDNTIRIHFNDGTHIDIAKTIVVIPKFNYTVGPNITSSRPTGQYDKGTQISVSPATIRGKVFSKYADSVQGDVTTPRHTFTINEDRSLTVVYNDLPRYTITGVGVTLSDANPFQGETVRVTITTPPGKRLVSVVDSVEGNKGTIANYSFVAQADRTITATFEDIVNPKIYFGHQEGYDTDMSVEATKEASVEVTALPVELSFANIIPVENLGVHGYWGIAVPKELAPTKPTIQTLFNGAWTNMLEGSMNIVEDTIDGKPYWVFMDKTKNRNVNKANEPFKLKVIQ